MKAFLLWLAVAAVAFPSVILIAVNVGPSEQPRQFSPSNPNLPWITSPKYSDHWPKPLPSDGAPPAVKVTAPRSNVGVLGDVNRR